MIHVQSLIDAIGVGALYALIAVGIGLVFGVLRLINFAYGQLIMLAAYALAFTDSWPDAASIAIAVLVAVAASLVLERLAFRPLRTADASTMLVATFAVAYLLQNAALLQYTYRQRGGLGDPVGTLAQLNQAVTIGSLNIRWVDVPRDRRRASSPSAGWRSCSTAPRSACRCGPPRSTSAPRGCWASRRTR